MAAVVPTSERTKFKRSRSPLHIDMTPMVDLAFLLLTFFVMTTNLMKHYVLPLDMPHDDHTTHRPEIKDKQVLNIVLGKNNALYWYVGMPGAPVTQTTFSSNGLRQLLVQKNGEINKMYVLIKVSDIANYKNVIDILDEMIITGITRYSIVALEKKDEKLVH